MLFRSCNNRGMCEMQKPTTPAGSTGGNVSNQAECSEDADCGKGEICKGTSCVAGSPAAPKTSSGGSTSLASINENNDGGDDNNEQSQSCTEQCPGSDGVLRNCTPPEADGTAQESLCNSAGRTESCGGATYCCPSAGGAWTTDMSACSTDGGDDGDDNSQTIADSGSSSNNNSSSNGQNNVTLPSTLPQSGPAEWLKFLQIGLGALGIGALLLLFL